jgi:L-lactate dehydrogenase
MEGDVMAKIIDEKRKVVVVGSGNVGSTFSYALAHSGVADEIVLIDANAALARGQALDLAHGQTFYPSVRVRAGSAADYADADVIVVTAGAASKPGETRLPLLRRNASVTASIVDDLLAQEAGGVLLMVSNPVDVLTYLALKRSGWPRGRVLGSGTVLDSARLRYLLSGVCGVDVHNVHAYVLGEHGDSEFAAWSMTHVAGLPMDALGPACSPGGDWDSEKRALEREARETAYHILEDKGSTCYGIGVALVRIVSAILRDESSVLTVSTLLDGEYGQHDVCMSVPCVVGRGGVERILVNPLTEREREALAASADVLRRARADM